jgi:hypothetical protein
LLHLGEGLRELLPVVSQLVAHCLALLKLLDLDRCCFCLEEDFQRGTSALSMMTGL